MNMCLWLSYCCCCNVYFSISCYKYQFKWIISGGSDYNFRTQNFTIYSGERRCVSIEILDDVIVEQNTEYIRVRFRISPADPNVASLYYAYIYIQDNDGECCARAMHVFSIIIFMHKSSFRVMCSYRNLCTVSIRYQGILMPNNFIII